VPTTSRGSGLSLRPVHPHHHPQPLRGGAGAVPRGARNGYMIEQTTLGAISPSTGRTLPDRYIEGTCPICGYDEARGDQCDNCGNQLDPTDLIDPRSKINGETPRVRRDPALLPRPAGPRRGAGGVARRARGHRRGGPTSSSSPEHPRGHPPARDDPRHRLGHPGPADGWEDPAQEALRLVRRGDRLPVGLDRVGPPHRRPRGAGASGGTTPRRSYYFMGKDNITFHSQIWPAELLGYMGKGRRAAASPGRRTASSTCPPRWSPASS
jgi:methionyl-tRNA synthetase